MLKLKGKDPEIEKSFLIVYYREEGGSNVRYN